MAVTQSATRMIRFGAAADAVTAKLYVQKIIWVKPTTAGDDLIIKDTAGNVISHIVCNVNEAGGRATEFFEEVPLLADGLVIDTLDSGTVDVYII